MKTLKQVIKEHPENQRLIKAVISRIGEDAVQDVYMHGADGGFAGFTYYDDTVAFFDKYKKDILALAEDVANQMGIELLDLIQSFRCLENQYSQTDIAKAIYQGRGKDEMDVTIIKNAMSWFALEEVCNFFEE